MIAGALAVLAIPLKCFADDSLTPAQAQVLRESFVKEAKRYVGCAYVRGAVGPDAFDCSGLIYYVARESIQYQLPRTAKAIYNYVKIVPDSEREAGDLVFFKTTGDGSISHVGIYIGRQQFISAVSDGPNTGVILSSLNESYWKSRYAASGQFIPAAKLYDDEADTEVTGTGGGRGSGKSSGKAAGRSGASGSGAGSSSSGKSGGSLADRLLLSASLSCDWSLFTVKRFMPNFRGLQTQAEIAYAGQSLSPGAGLMLRWNAGAEVFQIPVTLSLAFGEYVKVYAGPVFTIGTSVQPDTDDKIKASIFPGLIGVSWQTPSITKGKYKIRIVQDLCYSVFNHTDGAALSPLSSVAAGFVLSTGVRVTFPLSVFVK